MDGSLLATQHATPRHDRWFNFFADLGRPKYWVRATSPTFRFFFLSHPLQGGVLPLGSYLWNARAKWTLFWQPRRVRVAASFEYFHGKVL
jgi:hypothetical protein